MTGERRRDDWSYRGDGQAPSGWDEVPSRDPAYDPSKAPPQPYWDGGSGGPRGDPYGDRYAEPRYSFQPPPPAYAQYPPPLYANPYGYPPYYYRPPNPGLAVAAGVMVLVSGSISLLWTIIFWNDAAFLFIPILGWCAVIEGVLAVIAILGGVMAMMKRMFPLALAGAICSMLTFGFFGLSFILGLVAVILLAISKDAFAPSSTPAFFRV